MGFKQAKSKLIENGPLILSIFLNLQLPFLGVFATLNNSRIRYFSLFIAVIATFAFASSSPDDIFFSNIFIKNGSLILGVTTIFLFVYSIYFTFKNKKKLTYNSYPLFFAFTFVIFVEFFPDEYRGGTSYIVSNNLSPYLKAHTALLFSASQGKLKKGFTVIRRSDGRGYSIGYVLAVEGDKVGVAGNIPVVCKNINASEKCFDVRNVCEYLLGEARSIDSILTKSKILNSNEIALATYLDVMTYGTLKYFIKEYEKIYHLEKIFDMNTMFNFGTKIPNEYCKLPKKYMKDLSIL